MTMITIKQTHTDGSNRTSFHQGTPEVLAQIARWNTYLSADEVEKALRDNKTVHTSFSKWTNASLDRR